MAEHKLSVGQIVWHPTANLQAESIEECLQSFIAIASNLIVAVRCPMSDYERARVITESYVFLATDDFCYLTKDEARLALRQELRKLSDDALALIAKCHAE